MLSFSPAGGVAHAEKPSRHQDWHVKHRDKVSAVSRGFSQAIDDAGTMIHETTAIEQARIASAKQAIEQNRPSELAEVMERLRGVGLDDRDSGAIVDVLDRHPDLLRQP